MKSRIAVVLAFLLFLLSPLAAFGHDRGHSTGAVYAMTNSPDGNEVVVFTRNKFGSLTLAGSHSTGGTGTGGNIDPLASQNSLILSQNKRWLFAVNAGSNDISVFRVRRHDLQLVGTYDSGGMAPVSLTFYHNLLYVLNVGQGATAPNITGFTINRHGKLTPLAGSTRELPGDGFHQLGFTPDGDKLVVTKGGADADSILVFAMDEEDTPSATPVISSSVGLVPFGFIFDWRGHLLIAEAGSGAVTSYDIQEDGSLAIISSSVANGNLATCWIAGTWFGAVFTANTASDNISGYRQKPGDGSLHLAQAVAAYGQKPIDMATTEGGRYLYVLNAADGTVGAYRVTHKGGLVDLGAVPGLPLLYAQGIAAR